MILTKIAAVTVDGKTISAHFGRVTKYAVLIVEDGRVIASELRNKAGHNDFQHEGAHEHGHHDHGHNHGFGTHAGEKHQHMFEAIADCQIVLSRGMGRGAYQGLQQRGIRPILTEIHDIEAAVQAVIDGTIDDHPERLH